MTDYYAFGSPMPGRNYNSPNYRYGFNGQEKDDEIAGNGNINTAEFWEYDTRLGRRWNRDPIVKPWESPYMCFSNNPIYFADPRGLTSSTVTPSGGGSKEFPLNKDGKAIDLETISVTPNSTLTSAPTYATSVPRLSPDVLDFSVISLGGEAGVIGSINPSFKEYQLGRDPRKLYSGKRMLTYETDVVMGTGASAGVDVGFGTFSNVKPFENPFERIIEASDADIGAEYGIVRGAYNTGDGTYSYFTVGVGYGFGEKSGQFFDRLKDEMPLKLGQNPISIGIGIHNPHPLSSSSPTFLDSVRTSLNNRGDSMAEAFLKRNPGVIPKAVCITCK